MLRDTRVTMVASVLTTRGIMRIPFTHGSGRVGREDRLVRACIALSFLLLAGFAVVMSGQSSVITIVFVVLGLYFTLTAALGRDPFYAHFDIDTRTDAPRVAAPQEHEPWPALQHRWVDLRDSDSDTHAEPTGNSLLGH
jgi:hypothetical protein